MRLWYVPCEESKACERLCMFWNVEWKWRKEDGGAEDERKSRKSFC